MDQKSLKSVRPRRSYTPEFKADLVAQYLQGDDSLASLAMDQGMNPNVLHRWVREHERYGKHSLDDLDSDGGGALVASVPTNWIPLNPSSVTPDRQAVAPAPAKSVAVEQPSQARDAIELELTSRGLTLTLCWPVQEHKALADWTRTLLT